MREINSIATTINNVLDQHDKDDLSCPCYDQLVTALTNRETAVIHNVRDEAAKDVEWVALPAHRYRVGDTLATFADYVNAPVGVIAEWRGPNGDMPADLKQTIVRVSDGWRMFILGADGDTFPSRDVVGNTRIIVASPFADITDASPVTDGDGEATSYEVGATLQTEPEYDGAAIGTVVASDAGGEEGMLSLRYRKVADNAWAYTREDGSHGQHINNRDMAWTGRIRTIVELPQVEQDDSSMTKTVDKLSRLRATTSGINSISSLKGTHLRRLSEVVEGLLDVLIELSEQD